VIRLYTRAALDFDSAVGFKQFFCGLNPVVYTKSASRKNYAFLLGKECGAR